MENQITPGFFLTPPTAFVDATPSTGPEKRSSLGELWSQFKAGTFIDIPRMAGKAMQYVSNPGDTLYEQGKSLVDDANVIEQYTPELAPSAASESTVTGALAKGARMVPQSVAPAVGAGLLLSGVGAPAGAAMIGGSALAALPAGLSQAQETYEKGLAKHGLTPEAAAQMPDDPRAQEARNAGRMTGAIEWGGETAGGALAGRLIGVGGKFSRGLVGKLLKPGAQEAAGAVLKSFTNPRSLVRFGTDLLETAAGETLTEMGQSAGEAAVEQVHGYDTTPPWVAAREAVGPTLGMTALLAPFGIPARVSHARQLANVVHALENPALPQETRAKAAEIVYDELTKVSPEAAQNFAMRSFDALHGEEHTGSAPYGLTLDQSVIEPFTPRALQPEETPAAVEPTPAPEPSGPLSRAVSTVIPETSPESRAETADMLHEQPVATAGQTPFSGEGPSAEALPQTPGQSLPVLSSDSVHGFLRHFIDKGAKRAVETGQPEQVWERPNKRALDVAMRDFVDQATARGLVGMDDQGAYSLNTEKGLLRVIPPADDAGNYRLEFHHSPVEKPAYGETEMTPEEAAQAAAIRPERDAHLEEARAWAQGRTGMMRVTGESHDSFDRRILEAYRRNNGESGAVVAEVQTPRPAPAQLKVDPARDDAVTAIAKLGGIDYDQAQKEWGALAKDDRLTLNRRATQGAARFSHVFKQGGLSPDAMRGALVERSYLPENASINDLRAMIEEGAAGRHRYATGYDYELQASRLEQERQGSLPEGAVYAMHPDEAGRILAGEEGERRRNFERRRRIDEMSPEEMRRELLTDDLTGLGTRRAYDDSPATSFEVSADVDSLAWVNDVMGHETGDKLLRVVGEAFRNESAEAYHIFHVSGDEFRAKGNDETALHALMDKVTEWLAGMELTYKAPDGTVITKKGIGISYGIGKNAISADEALKLDKAERERTGERSARKNEPPGVVRTAPARGGTDGAAPREEVAGSWMPDRKTVEDAFPGQTVAEEGDGYSVSLKNGATVKVLSAGEIQFDTGTMEASYGQHYGTDAKPVASFQRLDPHAVITLTERGAGELSHETFHAAMALALTSGQRGKILEKFGNEEAAARKYQELRDSGAFERKEGHLFLRLVHRFFNRLRSLFNPAYGVFNDVATGKVWEQSGSQAEAAPLYSFGKKNDPFEAVRGRFNAAREQVDKFADKSMFVKNDMKPAMTAAGDGIAASWDGLKAAVNPMARTPEAEEAGRILIEGMGKMEHGKEQFIARLNKATMLAAMKTSRTAKVLDLMQSSTTLADKLFATMPEAERIDFMQLVDVGDAQPTPELQRLADTIKTMFQEKAQAVQALGTGALEQTRENYFPHIWQRGEAAEKKIRGLLSKRSLEGGKGFAKARTFDDVLTGIEAGFLPVSTNPIDLVFLKMAEMDKYINTHVALQAMEESDLVQLVPVREKTPQGFTDIAGRYGIVTKKGFMDTESGMEEVKSYRYVAREDVGQVFNNYLSQGLYTNKYVGKAFTGYMKAANTLNQFQLGVFSAFHAGFTSMEAVISHGALGIKALSRGDFKEAARYLKQAPAAWYLNPRLGDRVLKAWMGDEAAAKEMPQVIEWLELAGARRVMNGRFQTNDTQKMLQAWADGNKVGAAVRTIPALVEQSARPIMEYLVPRQKFGVFAEMANDWASRNPNASHKETREAMQKVWARVDSRLGQVVYDRLFVHNVAKNLAQALIRAPGWSAGTVLEVGGGFKDLIGFAKDVATKGRKAELTDRAAYTLSLLVTTAVANAVLTSLFTGEPPKDWKDLIAFRTGNRDEHGDPERFMLPTYMKDVYSYMERPGTTLLHKTHPMLSLIGDIGRNKDFYGTEIRHTGDNPIMQLAEVGGFTAKAFVPFWMKGVAKEQERGGSLLSQAAPLMGVMPAPADMNKTAAEKLASKLIQERMPTAARTKEQFEQGQLVRQLTEKVRKGEPGARQEVNEAMQKGKIKRLQALHIMNNARLDPLQVAFKRLSYEEAVKVYEVTDEREKRLLGPMLAKKRHALIGG